MSNTTTKTTTPEGRMVTLDNGCMLQVIRLDVTRGTDSWTWNAVISVQGELPLDPENSGMTDDNAILRGLADAGLHCQPEGGGCPGGKFADAPWIQYLGEPTRTLWVSQRGGLDV